MLNYNNACELSICVEEMVFLLFLLVPRQLWCPMGSRVAFSHAVELGCRLCTFHNMSSLSGLVCEAVLRSVVVKKYFFWLRHCLQCLCMWMCGQMLIWLKASVWMLFVVRLAVIQKLTSFSCKEIRCMVGIIMYVTYVETYTNWDVPDHDRA